MISQLPLGELKWRELLRPYRQILLACAQLMLAGSFPHHLHDDVALSSSVIKIDEDHLLPGSQREIALA